MIASAIAFQCRSSKAGSDSTMEVGRNHLDILQKLVGFPTVSRNSNRELLEYVGDWLSSYGIRSEILWNEDQRKGNLWATVGPPDRPGVILSGHTDVVPVDGQPGPRG